MFFPSWKIFLFLYCSNKMYCIVFVSYFKKHFIYKMSQPSAIIHTYISSNNSISLRNLVIFPLHNLFAVVFFLSHGIWYFFPLSCNNGRTKLPFFKTIFFNLVIDNTFLPRVPLLISYSFILLTPLVFN